MDSRSDNVPLLIDDDSDDQSSTASPYPRREQQQNPYCADSSVRPQAGEPYGVGMTKRSKIKNSFAPIGTVNARPPAGLGVETVEQQQRNAAREYEEEFLAQPLRLAMAAVKPTFVALDDNRAQNPFLSRLGSRYMASRSIQPENAESTAAAAAPSLTANASKQHTMMTKDNKHPLKSSRLRNRIFRSKASANESGVLIQMVEMLIQRFRLLDMPTYYTLLFFYLLLITPKSYQMIRHYGDWHALTDRRLRGRKCVLNFFVDKQPKSEFSPDLQHSQTSVAVAGTYRTAGEVEVITRFIGSVADSFRPQMTLEQHIVFVGTRDGGHLAQEALIYWPSRGTEATQFHIFASETIEEENEQTSRPDAWKRADPVLALEGRFENSPDNVHLYDKIGRTIEIRRTDEEQDDDDDTVFDLQQIGVDIDSSTSSSSLLLLEDQVGRNVTLLDSSLSDVLLNGEDSSDPTIAYFHVDGRTPSDQLDMLDKARSLLEDKSIAVVGMEHALGTNIHTVIEFFDSVQYKTFFLGLRQLTRIDNLCPEVLENVLEHPSVKLSDSSPWLFGHGRRREAHLSPAFFVAMPKGRHNKEETTIQHMYDLFSGQGGGGQVKTANDRKVPNAKK